jgi:concanavalin A-like lectin/glucanase superfamily protein
VSGQAFSFDGNGDYVSAPDDPSHYFSGSFTLDAWVKTSVADQAQGVLSIYECAMFCPTNMANSAAMLDVVNGQAEGFVRDASGLGGNDGGQETLAGPQIADGTFHHLAFIRDVEGSRLAMYVDGTEVQDDPLEAGAAGAFANQGGEADPLTIGAVITGGSTEPEHLFTGAIDDARMSDSADYPDHTPPAITPAISGPLGNAGWYVGSVIAGWTISSASLVRSSTGCGPVPITADTAGTALTCTATTAGGTGSGSATIKRDATAPKVTCSTPAPSFAVGTSGKRVTATVSDALFGPASPTASAPADTSSAGHKTVTVTGSDVAGNKASASCPYDVSRLTSVPVKSLKRCLPSGPFNYRFKVPLKKLVGGKKVTGARG